jgi:hypothetical protein
LVAVSERLNKDEFFSIDMSKLACFWQSCHAYYAYYYDVSRVLRSDDMSNMMHVRISKYRDDAKSPGPNGKAYMPNGLRRLKHS